MARDKGTKNGGGLGRTGRDNGLRLRKKKTGKTGNTKGTGKGHSPRRNAGKK